ncbi:MAG: hypothetical protein STHCBS139747_000046 [Sporothrix thermara]
MVLFLRALQLVFALAIFGTEGYAIHSFQGHDANKSFSFGDFVNHVGAPDAWGFLMFCAVWTILGVVFAILASVFVFAHRHSRLTGYACLGVEAVAVLSWLAGLIAVAVNIGSSSVT